MRIEVIDKWLKEQYGVSYTELEELHDFVVEKSMKEEDKLIKEIDRLKNIINELEKLELYEFTPDYDYNGNLVEGYTPFNIKEYIEELKENNNE